MNWCPAMSIAVYLRCKASKQTNNMVSVHFSPKIHSDCKKYYFFHLLEVFNKDSYQYTYVCAQVTQYIFVEKWVASVFFSITSLKIAMAAPVSSHFEIMFPQRWQRPLSSGNLDRVLLQQWRARCDAWCCISLGSSLFIKVKISSEKEHIFFWK